MTVLSVLVQGRNRLLAGDNSKLQQQLDQATQRQIELEQKHAASISRLQDQEALIRQLEQDLAARLASLDELQFSIVVLPLLSLPAIYYH